MRKLLGLLLCFVFVSVANCFAGPGSLKPRHVLELAPEVFYFSYKEPGVMKENGVMYGLLASYAYRNINNIMLKAEGRGSGGTVDYKNSGTLNDIPDFSMEFRGLGGYDIETNQNLTITPYLGVGYRYLNDDSSGKLTSTGAAGYERESNYVYIPIGVEGNYKVENGWSVGATVEYDIFVWGTQKSHLSDASSSFSDLTNDQHRGYGVRGSIKLQKKGKKLDFIVEPFIRYWNIGQSEDSNITYSGVIVGYGYEPKNNTTEYGINFGVKF